MIKSMSGYGRAKYEINLREYAVEIKTVNHKYNDIQIKMPRSMGYLEDDVKKLIIKTVTRGKIDVYVSFINNSDKGKNIKINTELAKKYIEELKLLSEETKIDNNLNILEIVKFPDVLNIQTNDEDETIKEELTICVNEAIKSLLSMKKTEGERISEDLLTRIENINKKIEKIRENSAGLVEKYVVKLQERLKELLKDNTIEESRLAQEAVLYSDKCSIEEELTRLKSHIMQFRDLVNQEGPAGKKLDFLVQEMNREINTIGSKANCLDITKLVIDVKMEIENIREQIQNIE